MFVIAWIKVHTLHLHCNCAFSIHNFLVGDLEIRIKEKQVALVTGGASGIGKATALLFVKNKYTVVIGDVNEIEGQTTERELREQGGDVHFVKTDVSNETDVQNLLKEVAKHGKLHAAVNGAAINGGFARLHEFSKEQFEKVLRINLLGTFLCVKYEVQLFLAQKSGGSIVNIASLAGQNPIKFFSDYSSSKGGIIALTKAAAKDYVTDKIRVNAVCPGAVETAMGREALVGLGKAHNFPVIPTFADIPGKFGKPNDIAEVVFWLSSPSAVHINGVDLTVDAGVATSMQ